ncbi:MAG: cytochrome P450, partial [Pseudomonadota bacterium]
MNAQVDSQTDFNPFTPEFVENPYPTYHMMRAMGRLVPLPNTDVLVATHYEDINQILKDKRFGHKMRERMIAGQGEEMANQPAYKSLFNMMLTMDAPEHTRLRGLVFKTFSARRMEAMRPR